MAGAHPVFRLLADQSRHGPVVVAHRGDSGNFPENTLPAFGSARQFGVTMQEFDVRVTRDGVLACLHDATLDRTTDAAARLGPGALVARTTWRELRTLDAGRWFGPAHQGIRVPDLAEVFDALGTEAIGMVEHKAGKPEAYVSELRRIGAAQRAILQSFDWDFVATARSLAPEFALALLGPTTACEHLSHAVPAARRHGAGMLHWHAPEVTTEAVALCHAAGLLLCTYTTDDDAGLCGGAALGFDAMCTNVPARMLDLRRLGFRSPRSEAQ